MKKKILLIISMFLFITNVKALTFNVDLTNIEDKGNNGTIGSIEKIDIPNKELDVLFQDIGDEVNFDLTISNTGDRAGTLKSITVESTSESIEYTNNLPETGLAINGNDSNTVTITAKVKEGAVNGTSSSEITIKYNYDEGSCPEGETLSEDESMCLCPTGKERNEQGVCIDPPKKIECADDEIYNETKKICEKKVIDPPINKITPSNPKTLDNIVLITLLFFVSGLGIYAVLYKKLQTKKKQVIAGIIVGIITLGSSFTVLAGVFGLDNLLSAIVNPITKSKEIVVKVNEEIDLIETWDGNCDLEVADLTPSNIFNGGSGTESDPYQIKTAEQLSCFAKSVNNGTTYEGQYIKQTKNIKLNDNLNDQATSGDLSNANLWITAGSNSADPQTYFAGTYDGNNHIISGLYITDDSNPNGSYRGMFGYTVSATFKNMILSDVYMNTSWSTGGLIGYAFGSLSLDNITTYGNANFGGYSAGLVCYFSSNNEGGLFIENTTNNIDIVKNDTSSYGVSGIIHYVGSVAAAENPNFVIRNVTNNGNLTFAANISGAGGLLGDMSSSSKADVLIENVVNNGNITTDPATGQLSRTGGIAGYIYGETVTIKDSSNTGNWTGVTSGYESGGLFGAVDSKTSTTVDNCYNSGDIVFNNIETYMLGLTYAEEHALRAAQNWGGLIGVVSSQKNGTSGLITVSDSYNTGDLLTTAAYASGIIGTYNNASNDSTIENCYNTGNIAGKEYVGGITGYTKKVTKTYNTGTITLFGSVRAGGVVGYEAQEVTNSYNLGDIIVTSKAGNGSSDGGMVGGVCSYCSTIKNSYNRGNIMAKYNGIYIGGVAYSGTVRNCYNSGDIIFEDLDSTNRKNISIGGITAGGYSYNSYNLGNLTAKIDKLNSNGEQKVCGISAQSQSTDSVNAGDITLTFTDPSYVHRLEVFGIGYGTAVNNFNAGTISFGDYPVITNVSEGVYTSEINMSNYGSSGNKFKNPNGIAIGCIGYWNTCTEETALEDGTYTTEDAPDILNIINGDDAFEIKEGKTLPTLKVFNE